MWSETLAIENATYLQYIKPKIAKLIILINVNECELFLWDAIFGALM